MKFTYNSYKRLLESIRESGYEIANYRNWNNFNRCVILRHDIDYDIGKTVKLATLEKTMGVSSTFFVLLTSDFYNVFSKESYKDLEKIAEDGHNIGLHFDELRYPEAVGNPEIIKQLILKESEILERVVGKKIDVVSMHRPSQGMLEADLDIPGMINSYSRTFFKEFKYLSDSRRYWREPIEDIIQAGEFNRLHILTHAFWYNEIEKDLKTSLLDYLKTGNYDRYSSLKDNFTKLEEVVSLDEIVGGAI